MAMLVLDYWSRMCVVATYAELDALVLPFDEDLDIEFVVKDFSFSIFSHFSFFIFINICKFPQQDVLYVRPSLKSFDTLSHTTPNF